MKELFILLIFACGWQFGFCQKNDKGEPMPRTSVSDTGGLRRLSSVHFFSDADAVLYVDNEKKGILKKDIPIPLNLPIGDYTVKAVSTENKADSMLLKCTIMVEGAIKLQELALKSVINNRLSIEQKKKNEEILKKAPTEIEMIDIGRFNLGKYEVTQAQWIAVMGNNPSEHKDCNNCPVEYVNWNEVQEYIKKLNELTKNQYRLPTEAEWEFAAKGGYKTHGYKYAGSNDINAVAWYNDNSGISSHEVGQKMQNEFGLYDMSGNVWEWCSSYFDSTHEKRVIKGGSWFRLRDQAKVSYRVAEPPEFHSYGIGFRLASDN